MAYAHAVLNTYFCLSSKKEKQETHATLRPMPQEPCEARCSKPVTRGPRSHVEECKEGEIARDRYNVLPGELAAQLPGSKRPPRMERKLRPLPGPKGSKYVHGVWAIRRLFLRVLATQSSFNSAQQKQHLPKKGRLGIPSIEFSASSFPTSLPYVVQTEHMTLFALSA